MFFIVTYNIFVRVELNTLDFGITMSIMQAIYLFLLHFIVFMPMGRINGTC